MRIAITILLAAALGGCSRKQPLPVYGQVSPFVLTSETGATFDSVQALKGKLWVADFMFTTCMGPCPLMTQQMRGVQKRTAEIPDLHLVSFTVDPKTDTPPVLAEYAKKFNADTERWSFLTGPPDKLNQIGRHALKLNDVDGSFIHSTRFVLIDRRGYIRGYYDSSVKEDVDRLVADIGTLAKEPV
ncbi:MAG TPA: SCO family protein [Bryobacteraceae bacterium]|nr:SCO family protein [Bryobacteraceae bacterium]